MTTLVGEPAKVRHARLAKRDKYRNTVCSGCHNNYYNFAKPRSPNGDVEVSEDYSCWHVLNIRRGKCICYFR